MADEVKNESEETEETTADTEETTSEEVESESGDTEETADESDDSANAEAMIATLQAEVESLREAATVASTEHANQIATLNDTITQLRAELWTVTKTLPTDNVGEEDETEEVNPEVTYDDLVAKATAKESE